MSSTLAVLGSHHLFGEYSARLPAAESHNPVLAGTDAVRALLELLGHRAAVFRSSVAFGSRTRSLDMLLGEEPHGPALLGAIRDLASREVSSPATQCDDTIPSHGTVLRATFQGAQIGYALLRVDLQIGTQPLVVVVVEHADVQASVATVLRAQYGLTEREIEVVRELAAGRSVRSVGEVLGMSEHTARHHTERVYRKVDVHSRAELGERIRTIETSFLRHVIAD